MSERFLFVETPKETQGEFATLMNVVAEQNKKRENWEAHDTPEIVTKFIVEEANELKEAVELEKTPIEIASEIGDVLYLTLRLCSQTGIDPRDAIEMKIVRNSLKYLDVLNSSGDYQQGIKQSREIYKRMGGDEAFYDAYIHLIEDIQDAPEGFTLPENSLIRLENEHQQQTIIQEQVIFQA